MIDTELYTAFNHPAFPLPKLDAPDRRVMTPVAREFLAVAGQLAGNLVAAMRLEDDSQRELYSWGIYPKRTISLGTSTDGEERVVSGYGTAIPGFTDWSLTLTDPSSINELGQVLQPRGTALQLFNRRRPTLTGIFPELITVRPDQVGVSLIYNFAANSEHPSANIARFMVQLSEAPDSSKQAQISLSTSQTEAPVRLELTKKQPVVRTKLISSDNASRIVMYLSPHGLRIRTADWSRATGTQMLACTIPYSIGVTALHNGIKEIKATTSHAETIHQFEAERATQGSYIK